MNNFIESQLFEFHDQSEKFIVLKNKYVIYLHANLPVDFLESKSYEENFILNAILSIFDKTKFFVFSQKPDYDLNTREINFLSFLLDSYTTKKFFLADDSVGELKKSAELQDCNINVHATFDLKKTVFENINCESNLFLLGNKFNNKFEFELIYNAIKDCFEKIYNPFSLNVIFYVDKLTYDQKLSNIVSKIKDYNENSNDLYAFCKIFSFYNTPIFDDQFFGKLEMPRIKFFDYYDNLIVCDEILDFFIKIKFLVLMQSF
ncbi:hypothetical protein GVAV_002859 [Gurleya vavrai]